MLLNHCRCDLGPSKLTQGSLEDITERGHLLEAFKSNFSIPYKVLEVGDMIGQGKYHPLNIIDWKNRICG